MKIKEIIIKYRDKYTDLFGRSFFRDTLMLAMITGFLLMVVGILLILIFRIKGMTGIVPLSYNVIYGVTSLGSWANLYVYLLAYIFLGVLNLLISWAFFDKERLISYLVGLTTLVIGVIFAVNVYNLTALVAK